jgi:hypothetical protein
MKTKCVTFRVLPSGRCFEVTGQTAKALTALVAAAERGCTALEVATWALRFAHYVLCLRRLGLQIDMEREAHQGGWHGRYRLRSPVQIVTAEG